MMITPVLASAPALSDSKGSVDGDTKFQQLANAVWQAIQDFIKEGPNAVDIELIMQDVLALNAYFAAGVPTQANNPLAFALYSDLSSTLYGSTTLLQACQTYGTGDCAGAIEQIEKLKNPFGTLAVQGDPGTGFEADLNALPSVNSDEPNVYVFGTVWQEFEDLMQQLLHNDGSPRSIYLIADTIQNLFGGLATAKVSDGYLTNLMAFFKTPLSAAPGSPTLLDLANACSPDRPDSVAAFKAALSSLGELSPGGGSLYNLVFVSFFEEEFPLVPPHS